MRIFILFDPEDRAYPILGLYTVLEKAFDAAYDDVDLHKTAATNLCVYEDETDQIYDDPKRPPFEPVFHEIPKRGSA